MTNWNKYGNRGGFEATDKFYRLLFPWERKIPGDEEWFMDGKEDWYPLDEHAVNIRPYYDPDLDYPVRREIKSFEDAE